MEGRPQSHDKGKGIKFNELSPQLRPILTVWECALDQEA